MPDRPDYFRCPLCRSTACERLVIKRRDKPPYVTPFYHCATCTVMFLDPIAFTRGFEDRPQPPTARSNSNAYATWSLINGARKDRKRSDGEQ